MMNCAKVTEYPSRCSDPPSVGGGPRRRSKDIPLLLRKSMRPYFELTKPRRTSLALLTTAAGFILVKGEGAFNSLLFFNMLFGTALVGAAANALNQYLERDIDAKMKRTEGRPIPSGRMNPRQALIFGVLCLFIGLIYLFWFVNFLTAFLGFLTATSYLGLYTPLKKISPWNTLVGAVSGAMPCLMGVAASGSDVMNHRALVLFLILFVWQMPHFSAIAWVYREDYERAGLKMLSLFDLGGQKTAWHISAWSLVLFGLSLAPVFVGLAGLTYLFMAIFFGFLWIGFAVYLVLGRFVEVKKFPAFSIAYLFVLNLCMILDKV